MVPVVLRRSEIALEHTWDTSNVFPSDEAWEAELVRVDQQLPTLTRFRGHLGDNPAMLADWLDASEQLRRSLGKIYLYASMFHNVDTADQVSSATYDRAASLYTRAMAAMEIGRASCRERV